MTRSTNFYPRTPCGVRLALSYHVLRDLHISIHVPRAGYDGVQYRIVQIQRISIHVPRAGYDMVPTMMPSSLSAFLSTYPVRGTTSVPVCSMVSPLISIHVPRAGYDVTISGPDGSTKIFLSTYPVRGTTGRSGPTASWKRHFYPRTPCGVRRVDFHDIAGR